MAMPSQSSFQGVADFDSLEELHNAPAVFTLQDAKARLAETRVDAFDCSILSGIAAEK